MKKIIRDELLAERSLKESVDHREDCEHDLTLHSKLKPHRGKPEYDPNYKVYRDP